MQHTVSLPGGSGYAETAEIKLPTYSPTNNKRVDHATCAIADNGDIGIVWTTKISATGGVQGNYYRVEATILRKTSNNLVWLVPDATQVVLVAAAERFPKWVDCEKPDIIGLDNKFLISWTETDSDPPYIASLIGTVLEWDSMTQTPITHPNFAIANDIDVGASSGAPDLCRTSDHGGIVVIASKANSLGGEWGKFELKLFDINVSTISSPHIQAIKNGEKLFIQFDSPDLSPIPSLAGGYVLPDLVQTPSGHFFLAAEGHDQSRGISSIVLTLFSITGDTIVPEASREFSIPFTQGINGAPPDGFMLRRPNLFADPTAITPRTALAIGRDSRFYSPASTTDQVFAQVLYPILSSPNHELVLDPNTTAYPGEALAPGDDSHPTPVITSKGTEWVYSRNQALGKSFITEFNLDSPSAYNQNPSSLVLEASQRENLNRPATNSWQWGTVDVLPISFEASTDSDSIPDSIFLKLLQR